MMGLLASAASVSLALSVTRLVPAPFDLMVLALTAGVLYRVARDIAGRGAARVAVALMLASLVPLVSAAPPPSAYTVSAMAALSLPWWLPLVLVGLLFRAHRGFAPATAVLSAWWGIAAILALAAPGHWAATAARIETAPAALLAGLAVSRLAEAGGQSVRTRATLVGTLALTCLWQSWLVIGTGRPARVLVPMLAAALVIAAADLLSAQESEQPSAVGAAVVIAMVVLGLVPGAHTLVAQHASSRMLSPAPPAALPADETPSAIAAP
jgi:hypothetical protein